jgi:hypothetical protein
MGKYTALSVKQKLRFSITPDSRSEAIVERVELPSGKAAKKIGDFKK